MKKKHLNLITAKYFFFLFILLLPALFSGCPGGGNLSFPTEYQAVFLDNGQVFFGRLSAASASPYLTLKDVFYVQRIITGEKKAARNILVKRGSEWHAPDFMRINIRHILLIEPVAPDSRVALLIREAKARLAAGAPAPAPPENTPPAATTPPPVAAPAKKPHKIGKKTSPPHR
jgi:hypothetical protein